MIVACPNCQSKYNLPEEKIAPTGSKVRCARCKQVFTAMPPGKDFDKELDELSAAEPQAAPKPASKPAPRPAAQAEAPAKKMPWDDDEPAAAPDAAKKMPWDDDEPAAGPSDDDDLPGAKAPAGKGPFDDEDEPAAPAGKTHFDDDGGSFSASLDEPAAKPGKAAGGEDDFLNSLGGASLDGGKKDAAGAKKKKMLILGGALIVVALIVAALFVFKPWTKMHIPFLSSLGGEPAKVEPADKVKDIALRNVRQYYIPNEKAGNVFVVEGKAVNNFATPKERIKVEITLFDEKGKVLVAKQLLCGNTLSQFQLQVQSEEEINASLGSEVGILTSNTYLKTGMDTPFMAVFFKPPDAVKEFGVKVVDVLDPK